MGSGCNTSSSCPTYFKQTTPDTSVIYTGPAIPSLGICTGDTLNEVEAVVLQKLVDYSTGVGIHIPDIDLTACSLFSQFVTCCSDTCSDLNCLMHVIFDSLCILDNRLKVVEDYINDLKAGPYNTACLTGLSANPTLKEIIQKLLIDYCALKAQVASIQNQLTTLTTGLPTTIGNFLANALQSCQGSGGMTKSGTGASFTASFKGFVPVGGIIPYGGPTAGLFDTTGLGLANTPVCGWALANGNNGTTNMVEQVPVGAGTGVMGGTTPSNASGSNYTLFQKFGEAFHTLSGAEIPGVSFSGSTSSSTGSVQYFQVSRKHAQTGDNTMGYMGDGPGTSTAAGIPNGTLNFTIPGQSFSGSTGGGGGKHENRQPSTALLFIQRIS